jgi:hypothetical protein
MKVAVVGSRDFLQLKLVEYFVRDLPHGVTVISGGARGGSIPLRRKQPVKAAWKSLNAFQTFRDAQRSTNTPSAIMNETRRSSMTRI